MTDERQLIDFIRSQRWFGSKSREIARATIVDRAVLVAGEPPLEDLLVEIGFDTGTHEMYQLLAGGRELDRLADPASARDLVRLMRGHATIRAGEGLIGFHSLPRPAGLVAGELLAARAVGAEQTNTSIVFDDELILKVFRRLEPGINPELELLRFLTEHGFANIAPLHGWYAYSGRPTEATLGILQQFVLGGCDGWELALDEIGEAPERFLDRLHRLGEVTGELHTVLASDPGDPTFAAETPSTESLGLLTATVDEEIGRIFLSLPDDERVAGIAGRGEEVREQLQQLAHVGNLGKVIRCHGDYHLGQTLWAGSDWVIFDFEGEPARPLSQRRRKRSPLRDVAGMLRSFAYAVSAAEIQREVAAPPGWEDRARERFLDGYFAAVDPSLLPGGDETVRRLLCVFELEKAVYELRYELDNRPDWIGIPAAGISRMMEESAPA